MTDTTATPDPDDERTRREDIGTGAPVPDDDTDDTDDSGGDDSGNEPATSGQSSE
jgi:hypothetical protein